jgi:hypothetical protein
MADDDDWDTADVDIPNNLSDKERRITSKNLPENDIKEKIT